MIAETIAKALGGRKTGRGWTARCPAHEDRTPSLSIWNADDNRVLVHCHAGCDPLVRADCLTLGRRSAFNVREKRKDPRAPWFRANYGQWCWELDALDTNALRSRVEEAIVEHIEPEAWERCRIVDEAERESLRHILDQRKA